MLGGLIAFTAVEFYAVNSDHFPIADEICFRMAFAEVTIFLYVMSALIALLIVRLYCVKKKNAQNIFGPLLVDYASDTGVPDLAEAREASERKPLCKSPTPLPSHSPLDDSEDDVCASRATVVGDNPQQESKTPTVGTSSPRPPVEVAIPEVVVEALGGAERDAPKNSSDGNAPVERGEKGDKRSVLCPYCGYHYLVPIKALGKSALCLQPNCKKKFKLGS